MHSFLRLCVVLLCVSVCVVRGQTCNTANLPAGPGTWNLSNWAITNQVPNVGDAGIAIVVGGFASMFGFAFPAGSFVIWGSGGSVYGASAADTANFTYWRSLSEATVYQVGVGNAQCSHRKNYFRLYVIGDSYSGTFNSNASYVWASTNEWNWTMSLAPSTQNSWNSAGRKIVYAGCVVDLQDRVYSLGNTDIWVSQDNGTTFSNLNPTSMYTQRQAFAYNIVTGQSGTDIMFVAGGMALTGGTLYNDVWASQTGATSWVRQTASAPWSPRVSPNMAVYTNGVIIVQGGAVSLPVATSSTFFSDAWISFDGAQTWQLLMNTGVLRAQSQAIFDTQGFFYLYSGYTPSSSTYGDAWRSNFALNNIQSWQGGLQLGSGYSTCTPYYNLGVAPTIGSSTGGSNPKNDAAKTSHATLAVLAVVLMAFAQLAL